MTIVWSSWAGDIISQWNYTVVRRNLAAKYHFRLKGKAWQSPSSWEGWVPVWQEWPELLVKGLSSAAGWDWLWEQLLPCAEILGAASGRVWVQVLGSSGGSCILPLLEFTSSLAGAVLVKWLTHAIKALSHQPQMLLLASPHLQQAFPILELALISELGSLFSLFPHWVESVAHPSLLSLCSLLKGTCSHFPCYFSFCMYSKVNFLKMWLHFRDKTCSVKGTITDSVLHLLMERAPFFIILLLLCIKKCSCFQYNYRFVFFFF